MAQYRTENPATGAVVRTWESFSDDDATNAISAAHDAFMSWRTTSVEERATVLASAARIFKDRAEELAETIATEMGKPLAQGIGEARLCSQIFAYYAEHAADLLAPDHLDVKGARSNLVEKEPLGVLLGVMPWNFPYYQLARFIAPNVLLGNTILLKPARICTASAMLVGDILVEAGLPADVYQNLLVSTDQIQDVIADPRVRGVSLTGSEVAGAAVAQGAGKNLKKAVLELGGSDAMLVLGGDIPAIAATAATARMRNAGQACNSPKRMIVLEEHYDDFVEALTAAVASSPVGDPTDPDTKVGPMSSVDARDTLMELVEDAVSAGAQVRTGGQPIEGDGAFMQPTVLTGISEQMRAYSEELFGPVAVVYPAPSIDAAVELANDSDFGLSGSVWSDDLELATSTARRLDVGMTYVNEHGTTLAGLPFGGVGRSGFGRELGPYGVDEFVNKRLVRVSNPAAASPTRQDS